jgi:hypothetical protein
MFGNKKKKVPVFHKKAKIRTLDNVLDKEVVRIVSKNPDLRYQLAAEKGGFKHLIGEESEIEKTRRAIKKNITEKALKAIDSDSDLSQELVETEMENIMSDGHSHRSRRGNEEVINDTGDDMSPIDRVMSDMDSLLDFREKIEQLTGGNGKSNDAKQGGFFSGFTLKDVLEALPLVSGIMSSQNNQNNQHNNGNSQQFARVYVVNVNGQTVQVNEQEYKRMISEGMIRPVAISMPKPDLIENKPEQLTKSNLPENRTELTVVNKERQKPIAPITNQSEQPKQQTTTKIVTPISPLLTPEPIIPELPEMFSEVDWSVIEGWTYQEPDAFVDELRAMVESSDDVSKFVWGFMTTTTYETLIPSINKYINHPLCGSLVTRMISDEGKKWFDAISQLIKSSPKMEK